MIRDRDHHINQYREISFSMVYFFLLYFSSTTASAFDSNLHNSTAIASKPIWHMQISGPIGPPLADYLSRGLEQAQDDEAQLIILQIDTPGGLSFSMRKMIKAILGSKVPVVAYVGPKGARAASAGTYLVYASHIAAMAVATNIGAATPIQLIGSPSSEENSDKKNNRARELSKKEDEGKEREKEVEQPKQQTAMKAKLVNDAAAYIRSLAQLRGRNEVWAMKAVEEGVSLSSEEAKSMNVIDLLVVNLEDLLNQLHGRIVVIHQKEMRIETENQQVYYHSMDWHSEFLAVITNPNVAYLLMIIGIYGLVFEFANPGVGLAGILGGVCMLLALYAFQVLPINYAGVGLLVLGVGLMIAEAFAPSFGVLGLGGVVSFIFGSIMLIDTTVPTYQIALPLIAAIALLTLLLFVVSIGLLVAARKQKNVSGLQSLVGEYAKIERNLESGPMIRMQGELWHVECNDQLEANEQVQIVAAEGVVLKVKKTKGDRQ